MQVRSINSVNSLSIKSLKPNKQVSNDILNKIINLKDNTGKKYLDKYSSDQLLIKIDKYQIDLIEKYQKYVRNGFNLIQFVRFLLNIIPHSPKENLFLAIGVIDLFREITIKNNQDKVNLKQLTNFMCEKILKNSENFNRIQAKFIPQFTHLHPQPQNKIFITNPPHVYGQNDQNIHKLSIRNIKTDCVKHSRSIIKSQFCHDLNKVFVLDSLTQYITIYDENCSIIKKIKPFQPKLKKQVIILSFAFSQRQYRIGAVLKDLNLKFWDWNNDFEYQKTISTALKCQNAQTNIYFLQYFDSWITADKLGFIYFWNLLQELPDRHIKCKYNASISDLCQISSLNLIVVIQQSKGINKTNQSVKGNENVIPGATIIMYNFFNGNIINQIDLTNQRIPHTLKYSQKYQTLFFSGLQKKIKVYQINPKYNDAILKGQLIGHQNLITCFTLIKSTPMLLSADDKGKIKLWDFRKYICLQTIDFSNKTVISNLLDMVEIGRFGIFGTRVNYIQFQDKYQLIKRQTDKKINTKIQSIDFDNIQMEMHIFVNKTLKIMNLNNGQIKSVFCFKTQFDDQFTVFRYFSSIQKFVLGTYKGKILILDRDHAQIQYKLTQSHDGPVAYIQYDQINKLFITAGQDSKIMIHNSINKSLVREIKNNLNGRQINNCELSIYHNLLVISNQSLNKIYIINYQFGKLAGQIDLSKQLPVCIHVINGYGILVVGTNQKNILLFSTEYQHENVKIQLIKKIKMQFLITNITSQIVFKGKGRNALCQSLSLLIACESSIIQIINLNNFIKSKKIKKHFKQKSNYNPFRQAKQNFISQIQKDKHYKYYYKQQKIIKQIQIQKEQPLITTLNTINILTTAKLNNSVIVAIGDQFRIKIWNFQKQLLCDHNYQYILPYKWCLNPSKQSIINQKIYFAIKTLSKIIITYKHDISISESKNLQITDLFSDLQSQKYQNFTMITQPSQIKQQNNIQQVFLLQNEFKKEDIHYEKMKKINFSQVCGLTLKELDNIKKINDIQKEWKIKQQKQQIQKQFLLKNIQTKAKKNSQKQHIQSTLFKIKKYHPTQSFEQNQYIINLRKKIQLNQIQDKRSDQKRKTFRCLNKFINKSQFTKSQNNFRLNNSMKQKKSFEQYYIEKKKQQIDNLKKQKPYRFRQILTEMNGRIKNVKRQKIIKQQIFQT